MDSIILQTGDNTVTDGDVIGRLGFAASSETGTNARLVVAKIEAIAEEAFDASNNATEMVFSLSADGAAASKMILTSAGDLNIGGELQTTNIGYTDGDNAIVIADGGGCTFPQDATFSGSIVAGTWQGTAIAHDYIGLDAIDGTNIADDAVDSEHYVDLSIDTAHIGNLQVTTGKIANLAIETGKINNLAVQTGKIDNLAVTTGKIADDAVTDAKLAHVISVVTSVTAPLIEGSTSVQTPLIEYTDGDDAITIHDGGSVSMAKAVFHPIANAAAEPEDATVNIDLRNANYFDVELGANVTDIDFTHGKVGQRFMIRFEQDASSGPYTIAWNAVTMDFDGGGSPVAVTISWPGGTAPTMTATDDKADTFGFVVRAEGHMDGFIIGQNMPVNDN